MEFYFSYFFLAQKVNIQKKTVRKNDNKTRINEQNTRADIDTVVIFSSRADGQLHL